MASLEISRATLESNTTIVEGFSDIYGREGELQGELVGQE
jgi:hypothetical protein